MSQTADFETLKRKLYLSYHQDGILDLAVGLTILGFGISMAMESGATIVFSWLGLILYAPLKSAITIPRMGFVQFDTERKRRTQLLIMLAIGLITLALFVGLFVFMRSNNFSAEFEVWFRQYYLLVLGALPAFVLAGVALWLGVYRLLLHSLLILGIIFAGIQLNLPEPTYVMVLGGIISLIGAGLLLSFMRKYPAQKEATHDLQ